MTSVFDTKFHANQEYGVKVVINKQDVTNPVKFKTKTTVSGSKDLNPNSVSPVLKTDLVIQLDTEFPYTLKREDFSVNATSTKDAAYIRYLNVIAVDDAKKTITAKFGGAWSGTFQMSIRHKAYGLVDTKDMILDVSSRITSISPKLGSIYGGTLVTITGTNFGTKKTDNPV